MVVITKAPSSRPKPASARRSTRSRHRPIDRRRPAAQVADSEHPGSPDKKQRNSYAAASPIYADHEDKRPAQDLSVSPRSQLVVSSHESLEPNPNSKDSDHPTDEQQYYNISMSPSYPHDEDGYPLPGVSLTPRYQRINSSSDSSPNSPQPKHESPETYDLERPGSPNKKQRNTLETHTPIFDWQDEDRKLMEGESLTPRDEYLLDSSPESLGKNWEEKWIAQAKELSRETVNLDTKFERLSDWAPSVGEAVMRSLSVGQKYHRRNCNDCADSLFQTKPEFQEPEYDRMRELLQARSRKLLAKNWEKNVEIMLRWFEGGLLCKHCNKHHHGDELKKKVEGIKMDLQKMDPYTVDQAMLDKFDEEAYKIGKDYLLKVEGTKCVGTKIVWRKQANKQHARTREDSAISMTTSKFAVMDLKMGETYSVRAEDYID